MFESIKKAFEAEDKTASIKFDRTITVPGYTVGGENGNLHVVQCEAYIAYLHRSKGLIFEKKDIGVKPMICIAMVDDPETQEMLRKAKPSAPSDRVLVVNKKFMSWFTFKLNAFRVAVLEGHSAKGNLIDEVDVIEQADVARWAVARENHGDFVVNHGFKKVDKDLREQSRKFATAVKREQKKGKFEPAFNRVVGCGKSA